PHHHPSSHFPSLDVTSVPPLVSSRTCLTAEHLSSSSGQTLEKKYIMRWPITLELFAIMLTKSISFFTFKKQYLKFLLNPVTRFYDTVFVHCCARVFVFIRVSI